MNEKTHSQEAEIAVLSCLMLYQAEAAELLAKCHSDYFHFHGRLYDLISTRMTEGKPVDFMSLVIADDELKDYNLIEWVEDSPSMATAMHYCETLAELRSKRQLKLLSDSIHEQINTGSDTQDVIDFANKQLMDINCPKENRQRSTKDALKGLIQYVKERFESDTMSGISTGFHCIDSEWDGLPAGLYTISGTSGTGKTAMAVSMAKRMMQADIYEQFGPVVIFSQEMSDQSLLMRLIADMAGITTTNLRRGNIRKTAERDEWSELMMATQRLLDNHQHLVIDCETSVTPSYIRTRLHEVMMKHKRIGCVFVDYFTLMAITSNTRSKDDGHTENANALLALYKQFNCPIVVLAQFNKDVDKHKKKPSKGDVDFGKQLIQNAHGSFILYKNEEMEQMGIIQFYCDKARDLSTFDVLLKADLQYNRMRQATGDEQKDYDDSKQQQSTGFGYKG